MGRPRLRAPGARTPGSDADLMTVHRFYSAQLPAPGHEVRLPPDEERHLSRVLRLRGGARVLVFDGRGRQHDATVTDGATGHPVLLLGTPVAAAPEPLVRTTLGVTVLKNRKLDTVVRDATTLGVTDIVPLLTHRTQSGGEERAGGRLGERWRGIAVSSAKQCGRAVVPAIHRPVTFRRFLDDARRHAARLLLVEPAAAGTDPETAGTDALRNGARPPSAALAIGPEGGWTNDEIRAAEAAGFRPLTLGRRTLRAETAPVAALAVLRFAWGDL